MYKARDTSILYKVKKLSIIYIALISIFIVSMTISYTLPNKRIINHTRESVQKLVDEGIYPRLFFNSEKSQLDNFTDSWMLNMAISADNKHPLKSSMENPYKEPKDAENKIDALNKSLYQEDVPIGEYSRYWHGYQTILRPLLLILNYEEIRYINMFVIVGLFTVVTYLLKRELGTRYVASFIVSVLMIMFMISPMSLQFSSMFYMTFISMIVVLLYHRKIRTNNYLIYLFFIVGSVTSFLDLLTVPLLTLGLPLITYILLQDKNDNVITNTIDIVKASIIWAIGYGITWATKWVVATIILKENVISNALKQILSRTSSVDGEVVISKSDAIMRNVNLIFDSFTFKLFVIVLVIWIILFIISKNDSIISISPILVIAIYPIVWYIILANHSYIHYWFTYRSLGVTIFAVLSFMMYSIDINKLKIRFERKH